MAPGSSLRHCTAFGLPDTESSNTGALKISSFGVLPPVARATAHSTARRTLSLPVATVKSLKSGFAACCSVQKQPSELPSDVAKAGIDLPCLVNSGSAPTSEGPKSDTITSILSFLAISAVRTFCVSAGSQLVTAKGFGLTNLYSAPSTDFMPFSSSRPWLLPAGPLRNRMLPPLGRMLLIQLPHATPSSLKEEPMNLE